MSIQLNAVRLPRRTVCTVLVPSVENPAEFAEETLNVLHKPVTPQVLADLQEDTESTIARLLEAMEAAGKSQIKRDAADEPAETEDKKTEDKSKKKAKAEAATRMKHGPTVAALSVVVLDLDITDEHGQPLPVTVDLLKTLPVDLLASVWEQIKGIGEASKKKKSASSFDSSTQEVVG